MLALVGQQIGLLGFCRYRVWAVLRRDTTGRWEPIQTAADPRTGSQGPIQSGRVAVAGRRSDRRLVQPERPRLSATRTGMRRFDERL